MPLCSSCGASPSRKRKHDHECTDIHRTASSELIENSSRRKEARHTSVSDRACFSSCSQHAHMQVISAEEMSIWARIAAATTVVSHAHTATATRACTRATHSQSRKNVSCRHSTSKKFDIPISHSPRQKLVTASNISFFFLGVTLLLSEIQSS